MFRPTVDFDCDQIVRDELAASLDHIVTTTDLFEGSGIDAERVAANIRGHRLDPTIFARYYELVLSLQRGHRDEARQLYHAISETSAHGAALAVLPFGDTAFGSEAERYLRWLSPGQAGAGLVQSPEPGAWATFSDEVPAALDLIAAADPDLATEFRSCIVRIIGASANPQASQTFGGASSFMLWGAVFLNVALHRTRVEIAAGLVHESAHQVLFALSCREPVVTNALEARFASPLRRDPRPIIGVYHATFVCARMAYAFRGMLARECGLTADERADIAGQREKARTDFSDGLATLRESGCLTDHGRRILEEAAVGVDVG